MHEDDYGIVWPDDPDGELDVDEVPGAEESEEAEVVEPAVDEPAPLREVVYTRGPNGRLIQSS